MAENERTQIDPMILIKKVIDKAAIDGALTENAAEYFNNTLKKNKEMGLEIATLKSKVESRDDKISTFETKNNALYTENIALQKREDDIIEREENMLKLELTAEYEAERVKDHKEMFGQVFRNLEIRRGIFTALPGATAVDQYGTVPPNAMASVEHNEESTKTE